MADNELAEAGTRPTAALRYRVDGMDCPSCAAKIETAVGRVPGAEDIRVNYGTQILAFRLDEAATPRTAVEEQVRKLGYGVAPVEAPRVVVGESGAAVADEGRDRARQPWWKGAKARLAAVLGGLTAAGFAASLAVPSLDHWAYLPAALLGLWYFGRKAISAARAGSPFSIEMLMSIATVGAIAIGATSEAAVVVFLFTIGELLEGVAAGRARAGIEALGALVPRTALLVERGTAREVPAASLKVGDLVLVRPGDRVSADGEVVEGESEVDESPVTGESVPVPKAEGAQVFAGSVNASGALQVRVTKPASDNTIARIIRLVEEAQEAKAPTARFIERFSAVYTPAAVAVAALVAVAPPLLLGADWDTWIYRGLALLLVACPCALVLSTPAAIASGLAVGTRRGLLVKGGGALETIGRVRTVAFDKTGTLTEGRPRITDVLALTGSERTLLGLAAAVENGSSHPLGRAILERVAADGIPLRPAKDSRAIPGKAVEAVVTGKRVTVGSPSYAAEQAPLPGDADQAVTTWESEGKTVVVVSVDGAPMGLVAVRDEPRADAAAGIRALRDLGVRPVMLTGDNPRTGKAIASALGLDVQAGLLPEDKLREIAALKQTAPVAMVGDGINDAPALAAASVGIAMGGGTDVALETADAALLNSRVVDVAALVGLSRATLANIHQNVGIALGLKAVFLVTTVVGITGLWPAVLADTGATVLVTINALRLLGYRFKGAAAHG
ncbi:cadmium-translocating P-type ATPase [Siccirubricoccus sp. KC 17139]|uniref:P-type Zn(2+) transporter n=1 Tax=Siccirubricoccus soli TaxID=2899147 RepID=A0ABT1D2G7_9PROT|nr:heavy metal translocating P-type ATPase [Siccirubricoccus soli]MCO6416126.1 cadmium-translocating P-type ATPase [Siccirubricoccus soli]MCP2682260.1 heavy metal translocating P-type ATPase [Siccirubricoccus soli]